MKNLKIPDEIAKSGRYGGTYAHKDIAFSLSEFICAACINE